MTQPTWRITVDSWISPHAKWYSSKVFWVDANSFPEAMEKMAALMPCDYLDPEEMHIYDGGIDGVASTVSGV